MVALVRNRLRGGVGIALRNVYIHDCDDGVLSGGGTILFEYCEFNHCGYDGYSHNIYVAPSSFTMRYCWSHNAVLGHQVKTRAPVNYILYNLISDDNGAHPPEDTTTCCWRWPTPAAS